MLQIKRPQIFVPWWDPPRVHILMVDSPTQFSRYLKIFYVKDTVQGLVTGAKVYQVRNQDSCKNSGQ